MGSVIFLFRGIIGTLLHISSLVLWGTIFIIFAFFRLLLPSFKKPITTGLYKICDLFFGSFRWIFALSARFKLNIIGLEAVQQDASYLLLSNHLAAVDIILLEHVFHSRVSPLKFFVKKQLLWLPFVGWVLKTLDYPAMVRYTKKQLRKNPDLKGRDLMTVQNACALFIGTPITFVNFVEGTRATTAKHAQQQSPYQYLLKPKVGGISQVLSQLHSQFAGILDVTLIYPSRDVSTWNFLCGKYQEITIHIDVLPITPDLIGDYAHDMEYRKHMQHWLHQRFLIKDQLIVNYFSGSRA